MSFPEKNDSQMDRLVHLGVGSGSSGFSGLTLNRDTARNQNNDDGALVMRRNEHEDDEIDDGDCNIHKMNFDVDPDALLVLRRNKNGHIYHALRKSAVSPCSVEIPPHTPLYIQASPAFVSSISQLTPSSPSRKRIAVPDVESELERENRRKNEEVRRWLAYGGYQDGEPSSTEEVCRPQLRVSVPIALLVDKTHPQLPITPFSPPPRALNPVPTLLTPPISPPLTRPTLSCPSLTENQNKSHSRSFIRRPPPACVSVKSPPTFTDPFSTSNSSSETSPCTSNPASMWSTRPPATSTIDTGNTSPTLSRDASQSQSFRKPSLTLRPSTEADGGINFPELLKMMLSYSSSLSVSTPARSSPNRNGSEQVDGRPRSNTHTWTRRTEDGVGVGVVSWQKEKGRGSERSSVYDGMPASLNWTRIERPKSLINGRDLGSAPQAVDVGTVADTSTKHGEVGVQEDYFGFISSSTSEGMSTGSGGLRSGGHGYVFPTTPPEGKKVFRLVLPTDVLERRAGVACSFSSSIAMQSPHQTKASSDGKDGEPADDVRVGMRIRMPNTPSSPSPSSPSHIPVLASHNHIAHHSKEERAYTDRWPLPGHILRSCSDSTIAPASNTDTNSNQFSIAFQSHFHNPGPPTPIIIPPQDRGPNTRPHHLDGVDGWGRSRAGSTGSRSGAQDLSLDEIMNTLPRSGREDTMMYDYVKAQVDSAAVPARISVGKRGLRSPTLSSSLDKLAVVEDLDAIGENGLHRGRKCDMKGLGLYEEEGWLAFGEDGDMKVQS